MAVRSRSLAFGVLEVGLALSVVASVGIVLRSDRDASDVIARERAAIAVVDRIVAAQVAFRAARSRDDDLDGRPEYGRLADLDRELGPRLDDADGEFLSIDGYRVEVLLPKAVARVDRTERRLWARSGERHDAELAALTFAVVALPVRRGPRVLRGFYLDGDGYGFVAEGVYAADRDPTIPAPHWELRKQKETGRPEPGGAWRFWRRPPSALPAKKS